MLVSPTEKLQMPLYSTPVIGVCSSGTDSLQGSKKFHLGSVHWEIYMREESWLDPANTHLVLHVFSTAKTHPYWHCTAFALPTKAAWDRPQTLAKPSESSCLPIGKSHLPHHPSLRRKGSQVVSKLTGTEGRQTHPLSKAISQYMHKHSLYAFFKNL